MRAVDLIDKKRRGEALSHKEIEFMVLGFTKGEIPDYQMSAWLMAVVCKDMDMRETVDLTKIMADSGEMLDLTSLGGVVVDKHSTGGVGDKTTLVVSPLVSSLGLVVAKMSGRGLGFTGGTLDKLESIPGFNVNIDQKEFLGLAKRHGIVVAGQSAELAPADGKIYALRDVTATVESLPLIASSIMSKKIAAGADAIVLDVKVGKGAFMKTESNAVALAKSMIEIGRGVGRRMAAVISDMDQPLGCAVGNALEVTEAIDTLKGEGPADFAEHCAAIAAEMLLLAGACTSADQGRALLREAIQSGKALDKFGEWVNAQGGDARVIDEPTLMAQAPIRESVLSPDSGYIAAIDALKVGLATVMLGAGRARKGEPIDHAVGIVLSKKVGDQTIKGEPLLTIHAADRETLSSAQAQLRDAIAIFERKVEPPPVVRRILH